MPDTDRTPLTLLRVTVEVDPVALDKAQANAAASIDARKGAGLPPFVTGGPSPDKIATAVVDEILDRLPELIRAVKGEMSSP